MPPIPPLPASHSHTQKDYNKSWSPFAPANYCSSLCTACLLPRVESWAQGVLIYIHTHLSSQHWRCSAAQHTSPCTASRLVTTPQPIPLRCNCSAWSLGISRKLQQILRWLKHNLSIQNWWGVAFKSLRHFYSLSVSSKTEMQRCLRTDSPFIFPEVCFNE